MLDLWISDLDLPRDPADLDNPPTSLAVFILSRQILFSRAIRALTGADILRGAGSTAETGKREDDFALAAILSGKMIVERSN